MHLIVRTPFLDYQLGDVIEHDVEKILASYPQFVVAIVAAAKPAPEPKVDVAVTLAAPQAITPAQVIEAVKAKPSNKKDK